jgi:hypothetical protein
MVMTRFLWCAVALLGQPSLLAGSPQTSPRPDPTPVEPVAALVEAFRTHNLVALQEPHGNEQVQALLLALIRDPRLPMVAKDIVLESASARYQDVLDRYVRGETVPDAVVRRAWEDHTVPNSLGQHASELIQAVRRVNATLPAGQRLRVLAGDPPIDWDHVMNPEDHRRWIELRDTYPADLVRRQVLDRGRRALVVYGQGHLQRAMIEANYATTSWETQTVMSLVTSDPNVRVFNVFALLRDGNGLPEQATRWPVPSLATVRGTNLGARDFATYQQPLGGQRVAVRDGTFVPVPKDRWRVVPLEQQFDALLYLGPPSAFTFVSVPRALCQDGTALAQRLGRMARSSVPPVEAERLKRACGEEVPRR